MRVLVLGAGGHAKVVADVIECSGHVVVGFLDDDPASWDTRRLGLPVLDAIANYRKFPAEGTIIAIGSNRTRKAICEQFDGDARPRWVKVTHPSAVVARSAQLGEGTVIMANGVVNPDTVIGDHVIINTGATVDHDCRIGAYSHIAPGAHLAGGVTLGEGVLIGIGASVAPGCIIGDWATVGAGATVVNNIPEHVTAVGTPARWSKG